MDNVKSKIGAVIGGIFICIAFWYIIMAITNKTIEWLELILNK